MSKIWKNILLIIAGAGIVLFIVFYLYKQKIKRNLSVNGINFLKSLEGLRKTAYIDSLGYSTIGYGHLIKSDESYLLNSTIDDAVATELLLKDITPIVEKLNDALLMPVTQNEFDAMVSIFFNIGTGWIDSATFIKSINSRKDKSYILGNIMRFDVPNDIIKRRAKECRLFDKGIYSNYISDAEKIYYYSLKN